MDGQSQIYTNNVYVPLFILLCIITLEMAGQVITDHGVKN